MNVRLYRARRIRIDVAFISMRIHHNYQFCCSHYEFNNQTITYNFPSACLHGQEGCALMVTAGERYRE